MTRPTNYEVREVETTFIDRMSEDGLQGAEQYVAELAAIEDASTVIDQTIDAMKNENIATIFPHSNLHDLVELIDIFKGFEEEHVTTVERSMHATHMLAQVIKNRTSNPTE